ncbi:hypothetical protein J3R30DRAFT_3317651 [Lentinula aciculospora]|uniref:Major facilitator superfamily MFS-1 n=1 Tax=Lentinula aciculospora TaxID=153920 RepID=A0A9W8ZRM3_9AGAR|nr:hypothetical protein J3R30DRAFT_3317651 [Lentinula aciculospora]
MSRSSSQHATLPVQQNLTEVHSETLNAEASVLLPPIPSVLPPLVQNSTTPLPLLPMSVLSITMLGEFLSSNVSVPFLLFMVKEFGFPDEADAAFWTGILVATFFLGQFLTSLLWAAVAEIYGRRFVLIVTLFGSAASVTSFGLSKSIGQAICIRFVQGIFAGAVGVARGSVVFITDSSNEGRAYAILGFCWGFGGLLGPIIGGSFERPAEKWPVFHQWKFLDQFPYILPTTLAGLILFAGSFLACFLSHDGETAKATVQIRPEKLEIHGPSFDVEEQITPLTPQSPSGTLRRNRSPGYSSTASRMESSIPDHLGSISSGIPIGPRTFTVSSSRSHVRNRLSIVGRTSSSLYRQSVVNPPLLHSGSFPVSTFYNPYHDANDTSETLSVAERVVLANAAAVNSIADLWVAAALNVEENDDNSTRRETNQDIFEFEAHDFEEGPASDDVKLRGRSDSRWCDYPSALPSAPYTRSNHSLDASQRRSSRRTSVTRPIDALFDAPLSARQSVGDMTFTPRQLPSIFMNSGVSTPQIVLENSTFYSEVDLSTHLERELPPILESRRPSAMHINDMETTPLLNLEASASSPSLPLVIIIQFGLLALHTTTHDQVFMSYLVSAYDAGGLSLTASDFAQLIALMGLAQIVFQFYLYPPPRGRLSHLTMYRIGTCLFIPAYLTVILYRTPFAHPESFKKLALMTALAISTAVRYCGLTFAFTSISVLLNYMTPPEAIGYANGLAQTIVSLARCLGPVFGGWMWSVSIGGHPSGYPCGFVVCAVVCAIAAVATLLID